MRTEALVCSTKLQRITSPVSVLRTMPDSPVTLVCVYRIMGKFGERFNLAIWLFLPNIAKLNYRWTTANSVQMAHSPNITLTKNVPVLQYIIIIIHPFR